MEGSKSCSQTDTIGKVVIIAAGPGNRLSNDGRLKPLRRVLGLTLIERVVISCMQAGLSDFVVVTGYKGEFLRRPIERIVRCRCVHIDIVENPDWKKGNGTSLLACRHLLGKPFVLVMCDHLFEPDLLRDLLQAKPSNGDSVLAVDRRVDRVFDIADATKVAIESRRIVAIGKEIETFDAVDTGVFLLTPQIFGALHAAQKKGGYSLSDGVREIVEKRQVLAFDIGEKFWLDVDTPQSLKRAKRVLLSGLTKPSEDGFVSHYINRRLSIKLSGWLSHLPISPHAITVASFAMALAAAFLFAATNTLSAVIGGFLVQISSIIDGCDGEIARLKHCGSRYGAWMDTVLDRYADVAIAAGITYGYWAVHHQPWVWLAGMVALAGFVMPSFCRKEYQLRFLKSLPIDVLTKLTKRDLRLFAIFSGALVGLQFEAILAVGLISHVYVARNLLAQYRRGIPGA